MQRDPFYLAPVWAWREWRFALDRSLDLLDTFRAVAASRPQLSRIELYRAVLTARTGHDDTTISSILAVMQAASASRPVDRPLSLRDIAHHVAVSEFLASYERDRWRYTDARRVVDSLIPRGL